MKTDGRGVVSGLLGGDFRPKLADHLPVWLKLATDAGCFFMDETEACCALYAKFKKHVDFGSIQPGKPFAGCFCLTLSSHDHNDAWLYF